MISKKKFKAYVEVQKSGVTNMFNIKNVIEAADLFSDVKLTKEDCLYIMNRYQFLKEMYKT